MCVNEVRVSLSAGSARSCLTNVAELHTWVRVFFLTIFFNDSIQLTNCDEMNVAMFHDKWKGRIETMATKKAAKKAKKAAKKKKH